ncbi:MAG: PCI domain-containing protein [Promethearchaeota archaeon]
MPQNICSYCSTPINPKRDFICKTCGKGFCKVHVGSTTKYKCTKCGTIHSRNVALKFDEHCPVIISSTCPKCKSQLRLDRFLSGQHFLVCDNCGWDSFRSHANMIVFSSKSVVLREAMAKGLVQQPRTCDGKLKEIPGKKFCPNCLVHYIKDRTTMTFKEIGEIIEMNENDVHALMQSYLRGRLITGIIDRGRKTFTYVDPGFRKRISDQIRTDGIVSVKGIALNLNVDLEIVRSIIYDIIRMYRIKGSFSNNKEKYYSKNYIKSEIMEEIEKNGFLSILDFANRFDLKQKLIKEYMTDSLKTKEIDGFFAAKGMQVYTHDHLKKLILDFALRNRKFSLERVANQFQITIELSRSILHELVKEGKLRGLFTQNREYVIEDQLKEEIEKIVWAYRNIKLSELAKRLFITEYTVEEILAHLIADGNINGYIDMVTREFKLETVTAPPVLKAINSEVISTSQTENLLKETEKLIEVVREYDFIGGQVHFKFAVRNNSPTAIIDVKVILDYPDSFNATEEIKTIPVIEPKSSRGIDFYLEPTTCGRSHIGATVIYKDYTGLKHTIHVRKKEVWIKCPLVVSTLDTIDDVRVAIESMPSDARSFLISDFDVRLAYHAGFKAISRFDARCVSAPNRIETEHFEAEAYFATKAKHGGRIVIRLFVSEKNQSMEIRVWCVDAGQLTGLLAKIIEYLFEEINMIRKIKAESKDKTIDLMAIAQGITVLSDYVMLQWKYGEIVAKLEDIRARLERFMQNDDTLAEMDLWIARLKEFDEEDNITSELSDKLAIDIERWHDKIQRSVSKS